MKVPSAWSPLRLVIDHCNPPPGAFLALIMIEAGQRAIVDHESEAAARRQAESNGDRGTNRSAMCNGDNVPALVGLVHARDRGADPYNEIGEAFAVWRAFVRSRIPEGVRLLLAVHQKLVAIESLPISEMLLGTLEQFKRNSTIICLQADAIENKSLPQSIELAGRCTAAQIMAQRVEETQQANAKEHEGAIDAQRKLSEMGAPLPAQSSPTGQDPMQWALKVMAQAAEECKAKRLSGQLASHCGVGAMR